MFLVRGRERLELGWEGVLVVRRGGDIGEHLAARGPDVFGREGLGDGDVGRGGGAGIVWLFAEDGVEFGEEHGEDRGGDVEGWGEDDADVADAHFVDVRVVDDAD